MEIMVYALVRRLQHPNSINPNAPQVGDIIQFRNINITSAQLSKFGIVKVSLVIPCGDIFKRPDLGWSCNECGDNSIDRCEFQKYLQPVYNGELIVRQRRYMIDYFGLLSLDTKQLVEKDDALIESERQLIISMASKNPILKTAIIDKEK